MSCPIVKSVRLIEHYCSVVSVKQHPFATFMLGAVAVTAALKTFAESTSGEEFSPNEFAFYLGSAGMLLWGVVAIGLIVASVTDGRLPEKVANLLGLLAGGAAFVLAVRGDILNYDDAGDVERTLMALFGLVVVGGGLWVLFVQKSE